MIPNYQAKWEYLTNKYGNFCPIEKHYKQVSSCMVTDLHHRCHNHAWRRKAYPLFIHSMLNVVPVNNAWHLKHGSFRKIYDDVAGKYERFLERHPKMCRFVNNPE